MFLGNLSLYSNSFEFHFTCTHTHSCFCPSVLFVPFIEPSTHSCNKRYFLLKHADPLSSFTISLHLAVGFVESSEPPGRGNQDLSWSIMAPFIMSSTSQYPLKSLAVKRLQHPITYGYRGFFFVCVPIISNYILYMTKKLDFSHIWPQHTVPALVLFTFSEVAFCDMLRKHSYYESGVQLLIWKLESTAMLLWAREGSVAKSMTGNCDCRMKLTYTLTASTVYGIIRILLLLILLWSLLLSVNSTWVVRSERKKEREKYAWAQMLT